MPPPYETPRDLVEALQRHGDGARAQFWQGLRQPLQLLLSRLADRHGQDGDERLTVFALHAAETWLRTRRPEELDRATWPAFHGAVLMHVAKMASVPFGRGNGPTVGPAPLPEHDAYHSRAFFLPYERVGGFGFGGDWYAGRQGADGSLYVVLADTTGHGYHAYLLASALPGVWQRVWDAQAGQAPQPADLLGAMHGLLADCLPEGIFIECTLARLTPDGVVTVSPAGGTRFLLRRRGAGRAELVKLCGAWLGLAAPSAEDQCSWRLGGGDEMLLGTDGVFDQLADLGPAPTEFLVRDGATLLDAVERLLRRALQQGPQKDDITMVLLRRLGPEDGPVTLPFPGLRARHESGDVPV
jgi:hypothetical protein